MFVIPHVYNYLSRKVSLSNKYIFDSSFQTVPDTPSIRRELPSHLSFSTVESSWDRRSQSPVRFVSHEIGPIGIHCTVRFSILELGQANTIIKWEKLKPLSVTFTVHQGLFRKSTFNHWSPHSFSVNRVDCETVAEEEALMSDEASWDITKTPLKVVANR